MLRTLTRQIKEYKTASILTPVWTAMEVVMDVLIPYVTASLIDKGLSAGNMENVCLYGAIMLGMAFLSLAFGILAGRSVAYASSGFAANLRKAMYRNIQRFAFSDIDKYSTSGLVTRMTTDVNNLQNAYQQILRITVRAPFRLILSIVMCLVIDARLSLIFIVAMIILGCSLYQIISRVAKLFQQAAEGLYKLYVRAESLMALNHPIMNIVVYGCIIALSWWGAHFIVSGTLTTGELTSLFTYVMSILQSLMMLSMIFVMLTQSAASAKRVCEVIEEQPDIVNPEQPVYEIADGSVEFRGVRFDYQSKTDTPQKQSRKSALYNVSFEIKSGETIGVIGGTGSGKSTLVSLISRLYDAVKGEVLVGGRNVKCYDLKALRSAVSVVLQSNILFSGSILDNLRWGHPQATQADCERACRLACADEFIEQMPEGYNTHIEQGGTNVSGGQKQRLCIARALLKQPKILILDDSTSACDTATDAKIQRAFREELPEMTKIIIAQRISSVKHCDRILVMDNGVVTGYDTHEQLLKTNSLYQEISAIQEADHGDFDVPSSPSESGGARGGLNNQTEQR